MAVRRGGGKGDVDLVPSRLCRGGTREGKRRSLRAGDDAVVGDADPHSRGEVFFPLEGEGRGACGGDGIGEVSSLAEDDPGFGGKSHRGDDVGDFVDGEQGGVGGDHGDAVADHYPVKGASGIFVASHIVDAEDSRQGIADAG